MNAHDTQDTDIGTDTRQRLINAGLELFGEHGFSATSTRMIARAADANIAAIPYYFGGKRGLYDAVMEYIATRIESYIRPVLSNYMALLDSPRAAAIDQAETGIHKLLDAFAVMLIDSKEPENWALIIMREQIHPSDAFDSLYNHVMRDTQVLLAGLIAHVVGLPEGDEESYMRAHAMIGQVLVFLSSRESFLRAMNVEQLSQAQIDKIHNVLHAHIQGCLTLAPVSAKS